jgi:hypothetical protein
VHRRTVARQSTAPDALCLGKVHLAPCPVRTQATSMENFSVCLMAPSSYAAKHTDIREDHLPVVELSFHTCIMHRLRVSQQRTRVPALYIHRHSRQADHILTGGECATWHHQISASCSPSTKANCLITWCPGGSNTLWTGNTVAFCMGLHRMALWSSKTNRLVTRPCSVHFFGPIQSRGQAT